MLGTSLFFYVIGVFLFLDKAFLLFSNILFLMGLYFLVGITDMTLIFSKKLKGTGAFFSGLFLIIIGWKLFGVIFQGYAVYEFFKSVAVMILGYLTYIPVVGPYVQKLIENLGIHKKNDKTNDV